MEYGCYTDARDLSWRVLIEHNITKLPVSISQICNKLKIEVHPYRQAAEVIRLLGLEKVCCVSDGLSFCWNQELYILYNSSRALRRIRYTIAHELGHCLLHHSPQTGESELVEIDVCSRIQAIEQQANTFAADLLAPSCVLWGLGLTTAEQIAAQCNISLEAGKIRLARLQRLEERDAEFRAKRGYGCFLLSPLEQKVYDQFYPAIQAGRVSQKTCQASSSFLQAPDSIPPLFGA